jgi:hypothetical protein
MTMMTLVVNYPLMLMWLMWLSEAVQKFFLARTVFCAQGLRGETAEQVHGIKGFDFEGTC